MRRPGRLECPTVAMFDLTLGELWEYRPDAYEPPDFDDFWRDTVEAARGSDVAATATKIDNKLAVIDSYEVSRRDWAQLAWAQTVLLCGYPLPREQP